MENKETSAKTAVNGIPVGVSSGTEAPVTVGTTQTSGLRNLLSSGFVRAAFIIGLLTLSVVGGVYAYVINSQRQSDSVASTTQPAASFAIEEIPLNELIEAGALGLSTTQSLSINGQLRVNNSLVVAPSDRPTSGTAGQIYYDASGNVLAYYDGTNFVDVAGTDDVDELRAQLEAQIRAVGASIPQVTIPSDLATQGGNNTFTGLNTFGALNATNATLSGAALLQGSLTVSGATSLGQTSAADLTVTGATSLGSTTISSLLLSSPLGVGSGGTGTNFLTTNGVVIGQGGGALTTVDAPSDGLCLISGVGAPSFQVCPGGVGSGVNSLNGLGGNLTIANATAAGTIVTIDNASATARGIASFNATNFSVTSGAVNTIQNIGVSSTPTFAGLNITSSISAGSVTAGTLNGNGSGVTNVDAALLSGQNQLYYTSASNLSSGTLSDARLSANTARYNNATSNFTGTLQQGGNNVCTTAGNCLGSGGGVGGSGTVGTIAVWDGTGFTLTDSLIAQNIATSDITVTGDVFATSFSGDGSALTDVNAATFNGQGASYYLNASNISSGTLNDLRLSGNVAKYSDSVAAFLGSGSFVGTVSGADAVNTDDFVTLSQLNGAIGGVSGGVSSLNGLATDLIIQGTVGQISVSDNSTDTITLALDSAVTLQGNAFNGANQLVQLNGSGFLPALNGSLLTNVNAATLQGQAGTYYLDLGNATGTLNVARIADASLTNAKLANSSLTVTAGNGLVNGGAVALGGATTLSVGAGDGISVTADAIAVDTTVCRTTGNCLGSGGAVSGSGTVGTIAIWDGTGFSLTDSIITQTGTTDISVGGNLAATNVSGNGSGLTSLNASNVSTGTLGDARLSTNVTLQGNTFNGNNQLVQLNASGQLPALNGSLLTNLNAGNISSGTLGDARLSANVALLNTAANFTSTLQQGGNDVCTTAGNCVGSGGSGAIGGSGTAGTIAVWTGSGFTIGDSLLSQSSGTVLLSGSGSGTISTAGTNQTLTLQGNGTGGVTVLVPTFENANGATYTFDAADAGAVNATICTTAGNCVGSGGAVGGSGTAGTIALWNGSGFSLTDSIATQSGGVVTITGDLTASNLQGNGSNVTNVDATLLGGQAASYYTNATNISTGTLADARLSTNVTLQGNTFNGANQLVQLNAGAQLPVLDGSLLTDVDAETLDGQDSTFFTNATNITAGTLTDGRLSANVALFDAATANFTGALQQGGNDVCTTAGNCLGSGGAVSGSGTAGTIAVWSGSGFTLADSLISQMASVVTVTGDLTATNLQGNGSGITNLNASNVASGTLSDARLSANVALYSATTANFTGVLQQSGNNVCTTAGNCAGGVTTVGALDGGTANANGTTISGSTIYLQSASAINPGLVNTGTQTFAGNKTFTGTLSVQDVTIAANKSITVTGGATGTRPASPTEGMVYYDTTTKQLLVYANGKWQADRTSSTKIVAMGATTGCSGSVPVASQNPDSADFVVTSCTSAQTTINNAISALPAGGGTVYLMEGTYIIDGSIAPNNNVTITGAGKATIIKFKDSTATSVYGFYAASKNRLVIRDLKIDGNKANNAGLAQSGIFMLSVGSGSGATANPGVNVTDVEIVNMAQYGIYMNGSVNSRVTNSAITASANRGVYMTSMTNNTINNTTVQGSGSDGMYVGGGTGGNITGNIFEANTGNGVMVGSGSRIAITGNSMKSNTDAGISAAGNSNSISGNTIASNTTQGIYLAGDEHVVSGNTIVSNTSHGIYLQNASDNNISGNSILSNGGNGIYAWNSNNRNSITSNMIRDNGGTGTNYGIYINLLSNYNTIANNLITDTAGTGSAINIPSGVDYTTLSNNTYSGVGATTITDGSTTTNYNNQVDSAGNLINRGMNGLSVGALSASSTLTVQGGYVGQALLSPGQPAGATQGTAGTTSYSYVVTAVDGVGETLPSTTRTITTGNATLNVTNFNRISWVRVSGAVSYNVYRTASAGTPSTTGLIGTVAANAANLRLDDTGLAASGSVPVSNTTGGISVASNIQGSNATFTGGIVTVGNSTTQGSLVVNDGSNNTATIRVGNLAGNYIYTIPVTTANDTFCLLTLANCTGGSVSALGTLDGGTPSANGASISGSTLYLQSASSTNPGLVNTAAQTFAGDKTFVGTGLYKNTTDSVAAFQVQNAASANIFSVNTTNQRVSVGGSTSTARFGVEGAGGSLWTSRSAAQANDWNGVTYGNGQFVAVSPGGTDRVMTSPDGITWTARNTGAASGGWLSVTYGEGLYVAVAYFGDRVMTSPDGITWTAQAAAEANAWRSVTYGNGQFVAVAYDGTNRVMTSPDGITWTAQAAAEANAWRSVTYGNGLFVAVACGVSDTICNTASGNRVMTSPDGITWTAQADSEDTSWFSVTYGNGLFVAVNTDGTNPVMTSPDGITWTARSAPVSGGYNNWHSVTYGNGQFVAVANAGTEQVMTSPDGINWTAHLAAEGNSWQSVTYGNNKFVAVSYDGTNRVMTSGDIALSTRGSIQITGNVSATGILSVDVIHGSMLDTATATTLNLGTTNANALTLGHSGITVTTPASTLLTGASNIYRNASNSTTAFQIQNSSMTSLMIADTSTMKITISSLEVTLNLTVNGHIISGGTAPTIAAGAAACTTPTVAVSGTDTAGLITVTTGTGCSGTGALATVTFNTAFGVAPRVVLTAATSGSAGLVTYVDSGTISTTAFGVGTNTQPADSTTYKWYYQVIQ